jgi:predicted adenine nucleotide alpha hydrolase (AANH) superfamily ATPase
MAQISALHGRYDETADWFAKARDVLDEQGARPLRALADFDAALMYQRRVALGDQERAASLMDTALRQFRELGMIGWISRAEATL